MTLGSIGALRIGAAHLSPFADAPQENLNKNNCV